MTGRGLRYRVILVRVREPRAASCQPRESAGELRTELVEVACAEAVDGDEDDERGSLSGGGCGLLRLQNSRC